MLFLPYWVCYSQSKKYKRTAYSIKCYEAYAAFEIKTAGK